MEKEKLTAEIGELKADLEMVSEKWRIAQGTAMERRKRIKELEEIIDACEAANFTHLARIDQLEQLCREMFININHATREQVEEYRDRMADLGLFGG